MRKMLFALLVGSCVLAPGCSKKDAATASEPASYEVAPSGARVAVSAGSASAAGDMGGAARAKDVAAAAPTTRGPVSSVQAGEWDDNANYRDYVRWLQEADRSAQRLDIRGREFVVVKDRDGKPVPNCQVTITSPTGKASLVTMASGRAIVFPTDLGLHGETLDAIAACGRSQVAGTISTKAADGVTELSLDTARTLPTRRTIDLAFVLDTTGSMGEEIEAVKGTIRAVADKLSNDQTSVRIGLVEYKDRSDGNDLTHTYPFSSDLHAFSASVAALRASGGGDTPEDMHAGLTTALENLQWNQDAVARLVVVIADAPPHLDYQDEKDYGVAARRAAARGIKLFTVSASGMDDTGQIVMRQMAQYTGASNMFVMRGGAGPESVGGGDPKSSCGGSHENYASGKLDQLIIGKVQRELASLDADPMSIPGRGQDENAKPCNQRLVMAN